MKRNAVIVFCMMLVLITPGIAQQSAVVENSQASGKVTMNLDSLHDFVPVDNTRPGFVLAIEVVIKGGVKVPGTYRVLSTTKLAQLIDYAGGATPTAQLNAVKVVHDTRVDSTIVEPVVYYDLADYRKNGNPALNPLLYPSDTIIISEMPRAIPDDLKK
jgi:hypothetical protein